jgi:eukaryotic-like serine/threonine-protein kinase
VVTLWQQREGQIIDGVFPLLRYLGGGAGSAVFLTEYGETNPRRAAIKLMAAGAVEANRQLSAWEAASALSHPHLIQILAGGECRLEEETCVYVVMEYADEDLSQVLSDRILTPEEAREMLRPVADALGYLHGKGFVHGGLTPSNILAAGEQVKISSDTVRHGGSPADDAWSLGVVLHQALTQRMPGGDAAEMPEPFAEIVRHCLDPDPQKRWSMAEISARLDGRESRPAAPPPAAPPATVAKKPSRWPIAALAAGVLIAALGAWLMRAPRTEPVQPAENVQPVEKPKAVNPAPETPARGGILSRVLPEIPSKARNTINGKVIVNVKISVDRSGNVQSATIEPPRSSKYLSELTVGAARRWKFEPGSAPEAWLLRFELFRDRTTVSAVRIASK